MRAACGALAGGFVIGSLIQITRGQNILALINGIIAGLYILDALARRHA